MFEFSSILYSESINVKRSISSRKQKINYRKSINKSIYYTTFVVVYTDSWTGVTTGDDDVGCMTERLAVATSYDGGGASYIGYACIDGTAPIW